MFRSLVNKNSENDPYKMNRLKKDQLTYVRKLEKDKEIEKEKIN